MWRYVVPIGLFLVVAVFLFVGLFLDPSEIESPLIGKPAPEFTLPAIENPSVEVSSDAFAGQYSLLNYWATWCTECRYEHPFLLELAESGVPIYSINWKDDRGKALAWLDTLGNPYEATGTDEIGDVAIDYGVYGAPETFLIGPDGTILAKRIGVLDARIWENEFVPVIESHREGN